MRMLIMCAALVLSAPAFATLPTLYLTNQFGEQSQNKITGGNFVSCAAVAANTIPSNLTSGAALPIANTYAAVSAKLIPSMLLTGYVAGVGVVADTDTVIQALQKLGGVQAQGIYPGTAQALTGAGAASTTVMETTVTNASTTYAITLAAPSSQDGQIKIIKAITTMSGTVTLAMTNIAIGGGYTARGTTTLTFTNVGDSAVFIAVGAKWVYLGGSAVAS